MFRMNFELVFFSVKLLQGNCRKRCRRIYIFTAFFSRDFLAVQSLLSVTFCYLFYSLLICTLLQKQSGPVVNTSSLPDIMLVIKAKSEPKKPHLHTRCSGKFDWFSIPIMMQFFQLTRRLMYSKVSIKISIRNYSIKPPT